MSKIFKFFLYPLFLPFWFMQKAIKRNNHIWVFGSWFGENYTDNSKELFEYVLSSSSEINAFWITKNKEVYQKLNNEGKPCYMANSIKGIAVCLKARFFLFSSAKDDINRLFMNGSTSIQLFHGTTMKKIGLDTKKINKNLAIEKLKFFLYPFLWEYNYDFIVSASKEFSLSLRSAFAVDESQIISSGYPRNDVFFNKLKTSSYIKKLSLIFNKPKVILYLPTFRDNNAEIDLFNQFGFDINKWDEYLKKTNTIMVYKPHFKGVMDYDFRESERIIFFDGEIEPDINLFMKDTDVLITDYSGAYFDFKLTSKPIILAPFDIEEYISLSRELYLDYNDLDDYKGNNWNEILNILKNTDFNKFVSKKSIYNDFYDGNSSMRLLDYIKNIYNNENI